MTSSWYSEARWVSSTPAAAATTRSSMPSPSSAASRVSSGRNRLPPAAVRWELASRDERVVVVDPVRDERVDGGEPVGEPHPQPLGGARELEHRGGAALSRFRRHRRHSRNCEALLAISRRKLGTMPSTTVATTPTVIAIVGPIEGVRATTTSSPSPAGVGEVHEHDQPDVDERRDRRGEHRDDDEQGATGPGRHRRRERGVLRGEAGGERDAGEGQQQEREGRREHRVVAAQAGPLRQVRGLRAALAHHGDQAEGGDRREAVGDEVEHHAADRGLREGQHADEDEAGVGDRGVGEQALDVGLGDREHRADDHGEGRDGVDAVLPVPAVGADADEGHAQDHAEGGELGAGGHEAGDRGRGALVGVRGPRVERHGADLEQQADEQQHHAGHAAGRRGRPGRSRSPRRWPEVGGARRSRRAGRRRRGRTRSRSRRAGSTSARPPARAGGGGGPDRSSRRAAARAPRGRRTW